MENSKFKPRAGQTLAVIGDADISKLITFGEKIEFPKHLIHFTHIGPVVDYKKNVSITEMVAKGNTITKWEDTDYAKGKVKFISLEPVIWWSQKAIEAINYKAAFYYERGTRYEFESFPAFGLKYIEILFRFKKLNWFLKDSDKTMKCSEHGARLFNFGWSVDHKDIPYPSPEETDPDMYFCCGYQSIVYRNF